MRLRHTYDVGTPFVMIVTTSLTWCDGVESKSFLLRRGDAFHSAMTKPSRKVFYPAATVSAT